MEGRGGARARDADSWRIFPETDGQIMKVFVLGLRGFPKVEGGVEKHAEHLYPLLAGSDCEIEVIVRREYHPAGLESWRGVRFRSLWAPKTGGVEAFVHSFIGVLYAALKRPDILHIHAIGPAVMTPVARLFGLRVVVTHHGPDYDREKWGGGARALLRLGERWGMGFSTRNIVISRVIHDLVYEKHRRQSAIIPNGVELPGIPGATDVLGRFSLEAGRYVLIVSRLVPEKRHMDLIRAFADAGMTGWKLAIVGTIDPGNKYCQEILAAAEGSGGVVLTGFQSGDALSQLYAHAGVFVLPSSHEGLPIALLEALSYGIPVLASDIPANLEVGLPEAQYFRLGDVRGLAEKLGQVNEGGIEFDSPENVRENIRKNYNWGDIAEKTLAVYQEAMRG